MFDFFFFLLFSGKILLKIFDQTKKQNKNKTKQNKTKQNITKQKQNTKQNKTSRI